MRTLPSRLAFALACALALAIVAGCTNSTAEKARAPIMPDAPDLSAPESSVHAYLDWTTYAYRMANSEVASQAMTPMWGVHVDSYIQKMRQEENKGIDQSLERFEVRAQSVEGTSAVLTASEDWAYRYFSLKDQTYLSPQYLVSYDTTYTLVDEGGRWLVDDVLAEPRGEVK